MWKQPFFKAFDKLAFAPNIGAIMGTGFTAMSFGSSLKENKAKAKLTSAGEPKGIGDANAYQFGGSKTINEQSPQLPYFG